MIDRPSLPAAVGWGLGAIPTNRGRGRHGKIGECTGHGRRARPLPLSLLSRPPPTQTTHKLKAQGDDQEKGKDDGQEQDGRLQDGLGAAVPPPHLARASFFPPFFYLSPPLRAGHTRGRAPGRAGAAFGLGSLWRPGAGWRKQKGRERKREARMKGRRRGGEGRGLWGGLPTAAAHSHFRHPPGALPSPRRPPPRHPSLPAMKITLAALALAAAVAGAQVWAQGLGLGRRPKGEVGRNCPRAAQPAHPPFRRCGPPTLATALGAAPLPPAGPGTGLGVNPARRKWGAGLARGAGRAPRKTVPRPRFKTRGAVLSPPSLSALPAAPSAHPPPHTLALRPFPPSTPHRPRPP